MHFLSEEKTISVQICIQGDAPDTELRPTSRMECPVHIQILTLFYLATLDIKTTSDVADFSQLDKILFLSMQKHQKTTSRCIKVDLSKR